MRKHDVAFENVLALLLQELKVLHDLQALGLAAKGQSTVPALGADGPVGAGLKDLDILVAEEFGIHCLLVLLCVELWLAYLANELTLPHSEERARSGLVQRLALRVGTGQRIGVSRLSCLLLLVRLLGQWIVQNRLRLSRHRH